MVVSVSLEQELRPGTLTDLLAEGSCLVAIVFSFISGCIVVAEHAGSMRRRVAKIERYDTIFLIENLSKTRELTFKL